jgi:hypothetical protein
MWALKTKRGSFIYEPVIEFDRGHLPCLFRTKRHAESYLSENRELFPNAIAVPVEFTIAEKKPAEAG